MGNFFKLSIAIGILTHGLFFLWFMTAVATLMKQARNDVFTGRRAKLREFSGYRTTGKVSPFHPLSHRVSSSVVV